MYFSKDYLEAQLILDNQEYQIKYKLSNPMPDSYACFGSLFLRGEDVLEFTFITFDNKIFGFSPEEMAPVFISEIVKSVLGQTLSFTLNI